MVLITCSLSSDETLRISTKMARPWMEEAVSRAELMRRLSLVGADGSVSVRNSAIPGRGEFPDEFVFQLQRCKAMVISHQGINFDDSSAVDRCYDLTVTIPVLLCAWLPKAAIAVIAKTPMEPVRFPYVTDLTINHERVHTRFMAKPRDAMHAALRRPPFAR